MATVNDKEKYLDLAPADWERIQISELFKFSSGKARPKDINKIRNDQYRYPVYGGNGILGYSKEYSFDNPYLILGRVGEYCGCAHLTEEKSWISDNALYSKDVLAEIDFDYFKFFFDYFDLNRFSNKNGQPLITQGNVGSLTIAKPAPPEQKQIALVLKTIQKAIQKQEEIINKTTALKKSLLNKLFTEGTKGEPLKQTPIGMLPESWEALPLESVYDFTSKPRETNISSTSEVPFIPMDLLPSQEYFATEYIIKNGKSLTSGTYIEDGDLLLAKITPSFENGKQGVAKLDQYTWGYATTEVIPIKAKQNVSSIAYLFYYLLKIDVRKFLEDKMEGSTGRQRLNKSSVKELLLPFPEDINEQEEIGKIFLQVDQKISVHKKKKNIYSELFKTILNELMTGSIRVNDIDFKSKISSVASEEASSKRVTA